MKKIFYYIGIYATCATVHDFLSEPKQFMTTAKGVAKDCRIIIDIATGKKEVKDNPEYGFKPKKVVNKIGF